MIMKRFAVLTIFALSLFSCRVAEQKKEFVIAESTPTPIIIHVDNGAWSTCTQAVLEKIKTAKFPAVEKANIVDNNGTYYVYSYADQSDNLKRVSFVCALSQSEKTKEFTLEMLIFSDK